GDAGRRDRVGAPRQAVADGAARRHFPAQQPLVLEPVERRVEVAAGDAAIGARLELARDVRRERVRPEPQNREEQQLFELAEVGWLHSVYYVDSMQPLDGRSAEMVYLPLPARLMLSPGGYSHEAFVIGEEKGLYTGTRSEHIVQFFDSRESLA